MAGVEQPSPEYPDPLTSNIEEWNLLQPPSFDLYRKKC
jgi:hypothetical protein